MRRFGLGLAVVAMVAVLSGCVPKPVPIVFDADTGKTTSKAEWRVAPVNTSKGPGIEIRIRNCSTVVIKGGGLEQELRAHLRPVAHIRDANGSGKVIFSNASPISEVLPAGSAVIDTTTPETDDVQRIIVPTSAAKGGLKIETSCTTYKGYGSGGGYGWGFEPCTTSTRSCSTRTAGSGVFKP
jgi:hypothetical protein